MSTILAIDLGKYNSILCSERRRPAMNCLAVAQLHAATLEEVQLPARNASDRAIMRR